MVLMNVIILMSLQMKGSVDSVELDNADTVQTSGSDQYKGLKEKNISPDENDRSKNDIAVQTFSY